MRDLVSVWQLFNNNPAISQLDHDKNLHFDKFDEVTMMSTKGETIHRMYRNQDYFGDVEAAYGKRYMMLIFWKKVVLNFRFLLLVII